jgi:hypothetical protein
MYEFLKTRKVVRVLAPTAAGSTNVNTASVNTAGFESVEFIVGVGTLTASQVTSIKAQQSDDNAQTDGWSDIVGASTTAFADAQGNTFARLEVFNPQKPWVRAVVNRGTANAVIDLGLAILSGAGSEPITEDATVVQTKTVYGAGES